MIPQWQEPLPALLEWAMSLRGYHVALHLSNLQKVRLAPHSLQDVDVRNAVGTNILDVTATRNTYTKLAHGPEKVKEVLIGVVGAGLVLWAPEDATMLTQWLKVWDGLNESGVRIKL